MSTPLGPPVVFGEVLFDCFEDGARVLGGAPFNVAWHLQGFGAAPTFVSRVGDDASGREIEQRMRDHGMAEHGVQRDATYATGEVLVQIVDGEPSYTIATDRAWDHIAASDLPSGAGGLLYHGTLALRSESSRAALEALLERGEGSVFVDVNLRDPFWDAAEVRERVHRADWVKLNADELDALAPGSGSVPDRARAFVRDHALRGLVVTRGARGAIAVDTAGALSEVTPARALEVVDTVGAGDAFASVLILGIVADWPLPTMLERAQAFASHAVTWRGAVPPDDAIYGDLLRTWASDPTSES